MRQIFAAARAGLRGELPRRYAENGYLHYEHELRASLGEGVRILDVGAGAKPAIAVHERPTTATYVGLDSDAAQLAAAPAGSYDELVVTPAETFLPELAGCFDLAVSHFALEHVNSMERTLDNLHRYLRPSGRFLAILSGRYSVASLINRALPDRIASGLMQRIHDRAGGEVFPARYDAGTFAGICGILARRWGSWEVSGIYAGARYFLPWRPLAAVYLAYEEWALLSERHNLAPYYLIDARPGAA